MTGLSIPIIGHNFNTYYKYMKNQVKERKYLKERVENYGVGEVHDDGQIISGIGPKVCHICYKIWTHCTSKAYYTCN